VSAFRGEMCVEPPPFWSDQVRGRKRVAEVLGASIVRSVVSSVVSSIVPRIGCGRQRPVSARGVSSKLEARCPGLRTPVFRVAEKPGTGTWY